MSRQLTRRKFLVMGATTALAGAALAACSGGGTTGAGTTAPAAKPTAAAQTSSTGQAAAATAPASGATVTLRFMRFAGVGWEQDVKFVDEFMKKHPNVTVKGEDTIYAEMNKKVLALGATGTLADLFSGHTRWIAYVEYKALCHELDPLVKTFPDETKFEDFFPSVIKDARGPGAEGKLYLFPTIVHPGGNAIVMLNLDLIEKAGLKAPSSSDWTVNDLEALVRGAGKPKDGIYGAQFTMDSPLYSTQITRSWGSDPNKGSTDAWILSPDGKKQQLDSPPVKTAFEWYGKIIKDGFAFTSDMLPPGSNEDPFVSGKVVAQSQIIGQPQADNDKIGTKFKWKAVLWPKGPNGYRGSCLSYNCQSIFAKTKYPEDAFHLLNEITGTDSGLWAGLQGHAVPFARHSVWSNPDLIAKYPIDKEGAAWFDAGIDPYPMPWNLRAQEHQDVFKQNIEKYLNGKENWDQMFTHTQKACQDVLDQPRP